MNKHQNDTNAVTIIMIVVILAFLSFTAVSAYKSKNLFNDNSEENLSFHNVDTNKNPSNKNNSNPEDKNNVFETKIVEVETATYTTKIYDSDKNRIHNIKLACEKLSDKIIKPDEEFSFNNTIGPMGKNEGFLKAIGFDNKGKKIKIYGGGLCQISSTIYNTALISGFEITERHAHSRRVNYVPKNKDATIMYGSLDLKFVNNSEFEIKIKASTDGHEVTIAFYKLENQVNEVSY